MNDNANSVQPKGTRRRELDTFDRKLLGELAADATTSYVELGRRVNLSPAAVHERVKRLRRDGVIRATVAQLNPIAIGKTLLAFIHVDTTGHGGKRRLRELSAFPEVEEVHTVAGDSCLLLKVRTRDSEGLEAFLGVLYAIPGVTATRSYVVLSSHVERPVQAGMTMDWPLSTDEPG